MEPLFGECLLSTAYLPPVDYFFVLASARSVRIEQHETYRKQSYRNRCRIYSAAGPETLSVPVLRAGSHNVPVREVEIDYSEPWVRRHQRALDAAYGNSAFFEYYRDDLFSLLECGERFLFDFNLRLTEALLGMAGIRCAPSLTESFVKEPDPLFTLDFRQRIHPKYRGESLQAEYKKEKAYFQVFSSRGGFIPNLSVVDLLAAEGPDALSYLR